MAELIMMIGLPASGKSARAVELTKEKEAIYISSDCFRKDLLGDENDQSDNERIFNEMYRITVDCLKKDINVVYDACNVSSKKRIAFIKQINKYNCIKTCEVMYKPYEQCVKDNANRRRFVPESAIKKMLKSFYFPHKFEGWDNIHMNNAEKYLATSEELCNLFFGKDGICTISHDNPHHTMTIGNHCLATSYNTILFEYDGGNWDKDLDNLAVAALLHDIGKPFTKAYIDSKGEISENAHYYQHHLISAYLAVPYIYQTEEIDDNYLWDILALIDYHMHPYFWEKENNTKMMNKYKNLWGDKMFNQIMKLHKADSAAH